VNPPLRDEERQVNRRPSVRNSNILKLEVNETDATNKNIRKERDALEKALMAEIQAFISLSSGASKRYSAFASVMRRKTFFLFL